MSEVAYEVSEPAKYDGVDVAGDRFRMRFPKGRHTPKNEREEQVLEHLVELGVARRVRKQKSQPAAAAADRKE